MQTADESIEGKGQALTLAQSIDVLMQVRREKRLEKGSRAKGKDHSIAADTLAPSSSLVLCFPFPLPPSFRFSEVSEGLEFLHSRSPSVVHGDVKPSNVLLRSADFPSVGQTLIAKLSDLGCASVMSGATGLSFMAATRGPAAPLGGTLHYQAPELDHDPAMRGTFNDVYSFAVMAVQIIDGKLPWSVRKEAQGKGQAQALSGRAAQGKAKGQGAGCGSRHSNEVTRARMAQLTHATSLHLPVCLFRGDLSARQIMKKFDAGECIAVPSSVPSSLKPILQRAIQLNPKTRPSMADLHAALREEQRAQAAVATQTQHTANIDALRRFAPLPSAALTQVGSAAVHPAPSPAAFTASSPRSADLSLPRWHFIDRRGQQYGPVGVACLSLALQRGHISADSACWHPGMGLGVEWRPLRSVEWSAAVADSEALQAQPPPPPSQVAAATAKAPIDAAAAGTGTAAGATAAATKGAGNDSSGSSNPHLKIENLESCTLAAASSNDSTPAPHSHNMSTDPKVISNCYAVLAQLQQLDQKYKTYRGATGSGGILQNITQAAKTYAKFYNKLDPASKMSFNNYPTLCQKYSTVAMAEREHGGSFSTNPEWTAYKLGIPVSNVQAASRATIGGSSWAIPASSTPVDGSAQATIIALEHRLAAEQSKNAQLKLALLHVHV
jgi:hypothetical protein